MKFATNPIFDIDGLDWLEIHTKSIPLEPIAKSPKIANATWEDRCACIGMIQNHPARALCSILIWGYEQQQFEKIVQYLSKELLQQMRHDKARLPNNCPHSPAELCDKIANMVLYLHLWDIWDCFTVKGKLQCGEMFGWGAIQIHERTYSNQLLKYQRFVIRKLEGLAGEIETQITTYQKQLKLA